MSSDASPRLGLPDMPETPELYPDIVADAFARLDAFTDLYLKGQFVNTPPVSPADGDAYLTGGSPTGAWSGYAYKIATCRDGAWTLLTPFDGLRAYVATTGAFIVYADGTWTDWSALIGAGEGSIASAATCDIGAAGSLFLSVTGTTSITGFGTAANKLRFLGFAGALTLTHHATTLILPGGASIVTAAGDNAIFTSDASGNWRCRQYSRANGQPVATSLAVVALTASGNIAADGTLAVRGSVNTPGRSLTVGSYSQTDASIAARANGNAVEWGHVNAAGYGSCLGAESGSGSPFLALAAEHGSSVSSYRTRGFNGWVTKLDVGNDRMVWGRCANASADNQSLTEILRLSTTKLQPASDNVLSLGDATHRYATVYAATGAIDTSDATAKTVRGALDGAEKRVAARLRALVRIYRFNDAIAAKGAQAARLHAGWTAQDVRDAFLAEGLDPHRYALFCQDEIFDMADGERRSFDPPRTRLGLRYGELTAFLFAGMEVGDAAG